MKDTRNVEERISLWLEEDAMRHFPDHLLKATYEQTRKSRQQVGWRGFLAGLRLPRFVSAMASAAVVVLAVALALSFFSNRPGMIGPAPSVTPSPTPTPTPSPTPDPWEAFIGTFVSDPGDADQGVQTMTVERSGVGSVDIVVIDTIASVCKLTPSTMTGTGHVEDNARLVIPRPDYKCDDGSDPHLTNGDPTPLNEFLRNLTYTLDEATGNLTVGTLEEGTLAVWVRQGPADPSASQPPGSSAIPRSTASLAPSAQMWPQSTLDEVRAAQELADAGDPDYTWQVDPALVGGAEPWGSEVLDRFAREKLGWEAFKHGNGWASGDAGSLYTELVLFRCEPGAANPLYPDDPEGADCAPTIDDFHYETVMLTLEQPVRGDSSGIWVVTEWEMLQPSKPSSLFGQLYPDFTQGQVEQVAPPSDTEATEFLEAFLAARVAGEGAEEFVLTEPEGSPFDNEETPLLYGTTGSAPYERYETDRLGGPVWPSGWIEFRTRLFAGDETVVEQSFAVIRQEDGRLGLVYGYPQTDEFPTTENGQPVPIPYAFLDGEVTLAAALPWSGEPPVMYLGNPGHGETFQIVADPLTVAGCEPGPAPADADALAQNILSNPNLEVTAPVAASVGGIDALQLDVVAAAGASLCPQPYQGPLVLNQTDSGPLEIGQENRMRLYLLDLPGGSAQTLAIAIAAPESEFERVAEEAAPIVDSIEFHTP